MTYARPDTLVSFAVRSFALQFEDDRNSLLLPGFASAQTQVRQRIKRNLWATLALENLFDREYLVGRGVVNNIGPPRLWRAGLRWGN